MDRLSILLAIRNDDPNGWESVQPTTKDYRDFDESVIDRYGKEIWHEYMAGGWEPMRDV